MGLQMLSVPGLLCSVMVTPTSQLIHIEDWTYPAIDGVFVTRQEGD